MTETEINMVAALRRGDESAFDDLFRAWYEPLVRYANKLTDNDLDAAEDLVQQVFCKFWEQRAQLDIQFSVKAYLYRMVYHQGLSAIRAEKTRERYTQHQQRVMENANESAPDQQGGELQKIYATALQKLPPQCRQVFELSRFESLKYREIADQLGISVKTVEAHMGKALRVLRFELSDYLVTFVGIAISFLFNFLTISPLCNWI
jgi:RNA polymerase sigma-70 factor, ECF subfamily